MKKGMKEIRTYEKWIAIDNKKKYDSKEWMEKDGGKMNEWIYDRGKIESRKKC